MLSMCRDTAADISHDENLLTVVLVITLMLMCCTGVVLQNTFGILEKIANMSSVKLVGFKRKHSS